MSREVTFRQRAFGADERAAALQIGAVLLFGFLVISLVFYQAFIVPQETRAAEFDAYQEASNQFVQLTTTWSTPARTGLAPAPR